MTKLDIAVMHAPWDSVRRANVLRMARILAPQGVRLRVVEDKSRSGAWPTGRNAWLTSPPGTTHQLVLQDDVELCDNFVAQVLAVVEANPTSIISLYCPVGAVRKASGHWLTIRGMTWGPALLMPVPKARTVMTWVRTFIPEDSTKSYDWRIAMFTRCEVEPLWVTSPSLVQHLNPQSSLMGHTSPILIRVASLYRQDPGPIDWSKGLDAPLDLGVAAKGSVERYLSEQGRRRYLKGATGRLKPDMRAEEVEVLERALLAIAAPLSRPLDVLEWGAGGSTQYFTEFLSARGVAHTWFSLEYNREWYAKVKAAVGPTVELALFDVGNLQQAQRETPMDEYVAYPSTLGRTFDFILVDGRKRRRCLLEALHLLNPGGRVYLHDAHRKYYHCATAVYPRGEFVLPRLWEGRMT
jgi:SAM-dependent methyltransferase